MKQQLTQKDEQREIHRNESINLEEQIKAFERQQMEMENQIDELTGQLQIKDNEMLQMQQNLDFNSSFDMMNLKQNINNQGGVSERSINM